MKIFYNLGAKLNVADEKIVLQSPLYLCDYVLERKVFFGPLCHFSCQPIGTNFTSAEI